MSEDRIQAPVLTGDRLLGIAEQVLAGGVRDVVDWTVEQLNGGTVGAVFIVKGQALCSDGAVHPWSAVLKVQKCWSRPGDPLSWRRELLMYQSGIFDLLPEGLDVPRCYGVEDKGKEILLWLERLTGSHSEGLNTDDYARVAHHMGHFQGSVTARLPAQAWLSSRYTLVHYAADWGTGAMRLLQDDKGRLSQLLTGRLESELWELWARRDAYLDMLRHLPCTLTHRDLTPGNVFVSDERVCILDWDCAGIGVLGEDMADLLAEALVYYDFDVSQAASLYDAITAGYISGLDASGWRGDTTRVRTAMGVHLGMHWCPRIVCCASRTEEPVAHGRYGETLRYFLQLAGRSLA